MYKKISGIYKITCLGNNKFYIGSAVDIKQRWNKHKNNLRKNKHENQHLQNSFNKYGEDSFVFDIIEVVDDVNNLLTREQYWIDILNATDKKVGFNILPKAGSRLGYCCKKETKDKISKSLKDRVRPDLSGKNNPMYGRCGELHPNYKKPLSKEQKEQISKTLTGKYTKENNPNYNRGKKVVCITNRLIFNNAERAGEYFKIHSSSIRKVCNNKAYSTHGLRFCYLENYSKDLVNKRHVRKNCKKIICVDINEVFNSVKDCSIKLNISYCGISAVLKGRQKTTGGYGFKYYEE